MKIYILSYICAAIVFLGLDMLWLSTMSNLLYKPVLGDLMLEKPNLGPAAIFYLIYIAGIVIFAISPALNSGRWTAALLYGALFGFFCYATYDLTNQATLKTWSLTITFADICWGTFVTSVASLAGFTGATIAGR